VRGGYTLMEGDNQVPKDKLKGGKNNDTEKKDVTEVCINHDPVESFVGAIESKPKDSSIILFV